MIPLRTCYVDPGRWHAQRTYDSKGFRSVLEAVEPEHRMGEVAALGDLKLHFPLARGLHEPTHNLHVQRDATVWRAARRRLIVDECAAGNLDAPVGIEVARR